MAITMETMERSPLWFDMQKEEIDYLLRFFSQKVINGEELVTRLRRSPGSSLIFTLDELSFLGRVKRRDGLEPKGDWSDRGRRVFYVIKQGKLRACRIQESTYIVHALDLAHYLDGWFLNVKATGGRVPAEISESYSPLRG